MAGDVRQQLREAYELIKARKRKEAIPILLPILKADEDNADAWWLLATCLDDPNDVREALENVLRLKPEHEKAQTMLNVINERYPPPPPEPEDEDDFWEGDSASQPFAGLPDEDIRLAESESAEPAEPVEGFVDADADGDFIAIPDEGAATDDPFAAFAEEPVDTVDDAPDLFAELEDPFAVPAEPFGAASEPAPVPEEDPFAAPLSPFDSEPEPFGGPPETFGAPAGEPALADEVSDDDPFADPFAVMDEAGDALDDLGDPFADLVEDDAVAEPAGEDPFAAPTPRERPARKPASKPARQQAARSKRQPAASATQRQRAKKDPFGDAPAGRPARAARSSKGKGGTNPLVLLLAVIGAISLLVCLACGVVSLAAPAILNQIGGTIMNQVNSPEFLTTLESFGQGSLDTAVNRGSLGYGETRRDTLGAGQTHAWTFSGNAGDQITIDMIATGGDLDPYLSLYDPSGNLIATDDDSGSDFNAQLSIRLPGGGTYTIAASSFFETSSGSYELHLRR
ncbi:MAG: hypothetical protein Kow0077_05930 [Anaerolineae bacterium]